MKWMRSLTCSAAVILALAAGCSPRSHLEPCDSSDECSSGLECFVPVVVAQSGSCVYGRLGLSSGESCHSRCTADADCSHLGDAYGCATLGCEGSDRICLRKGGAGTIASADGGS